jgi:hypothetical protein
MPKVWLVTGSASGLAAWVEKPGSKNLTPGWVEGWVNKSGIQGFEAHGSFA